MATTTKRKRINEQDRKTAVSSELAPLYAVAGLTEVVTTRLRSVATESRQLVTDRIAELRSTRTEQVNQAVGELKNRSWDDLVRTVPEFTKQQLSRFGEQADVRLSKAGAAYAELAGRGKVGVDGALGDAAVSLDPVLERLQEGVTQLRKSISGRTATETVTPRSAAKASATRTANTAAARKAPAKKAAAKKADS